MVFQVRQWICLIWTAFIALPSVLYVIWDKYPGPKIQVNKDINMCGTLNGKKSIDISETTDKINAIEQLYN